jgi:hypothetical protein
MPDDILEDCILVAKESLDSHDFETEGVEVGIGGNNVNRLLKK